MSVRAILGQQVSVKGASTMAGRVAAEFGTRRRRRRFFPSADKLADADLTRVGVTRQRAQFHSRSGALRRAPTKFDSTRAIEPDEFERQDHAASQESAPWTAQYIAMRLGEPDAFPGTDLYLRKAASDHESWRPWRAYAAMYIWKAELYKETAQ